MLSSRAASVTTADFCRQAGLERGGALPPFRQQGADVRGLIGFIEDSCFGLVNQLAETAQLDAHPTLQARRIVAVLLQFAEKNPGMARVMVGEALILEHERLTARI